MVDLHAIQEDEFGQRIHAVLFLSSPIQSHEFLFGRDGQLDRIRWALMAPGRQVFIYGERGSEVKSSLQEINMATIPPKGDRHRNGAVRERS